MSATTRYATRIELRQRLDHTGGENYSSTEDVVHEAILDAVSQAVNGYCSRAFYSLSATTRYFTALWADVLQVPDLVSVTTLATDENGTGTYNRTWATTDYMLYPFNASDSDPAMPYTQIRMDTRTPGDGWAFPVGIPKGVKVVGTWGWPAVPAAVKEVTLLESLRLLQQLQGPNGVVASSELGAMIVLPQLHPTSKMLLMPYRRMGARVADGAAA